MSPSRLSHKLRLPKILRRSVTRLVLILLSIFGALYLFADGSLLPWNGNTTGRPKLSHELNEAEDVISRGGSGIENLDRLDALIARGSGFQRVVQYTIEGDPVFSMLEYKGRKLEYTVDTTEDAFGFPGLVTVSCSELNRAETGTLLEYTLAGCEGEQAERRLLGIDFDLAGQERFEFVLKYGVDRKNEINTAAQRLVKDLRNGSAVEVSDFQLPDNALQSIFRELMLTNSLEEKTLSEECKKKPYTGYELTVQLNQAEHHFAWSECDTGTDGRRMTSVAQFIIDQVEADAAYQGLPEAEGWYK